MKQNNTSVYPLFTLRINTTGTSGALCVPFWTPLLHFPPPTEVTSTLRFVLVASLLLFMKIIFYLISCLCLYITVTCSFSSYSFSSVFFPLKYCILRHIKADVIAFFLEIKQAVLKYEPQNNPKQLGERKIKLEASRALFSNYNTKI